jgi:hypothetical protein
MNTAPSSELKNGNPSWLDQLRLPDNYTNTIGGVKLPTKPSFGKLNKHRFSRVHPDPSYQVPVLIVEDKDSSETYIATHAVAGYLGKAAIPKLLRLAVDNAGAPKIIAQPIPDLNNRTNLWNVTCIQAIQIAEVEWVRIESDMNAQQYTIIKAANNLGEPQWPDQTMSELIQAVFLNNVISSPDHPYVKHLEGRV